LLALLFYRHLFVFFVVSENNEWILKEIFAKFFKYEPKNIGYGDVYRIIQ